VAGPAAATGTDPVPGFPDRPATAPQPRVWRPPHRRQQLTWVIAAAAVLVVVVAGTLLALTTHGHHPADHSAGAPGGSNSATTGPGPSSAAPAPSQPASRPSGVGPPTIPAGYHDYQDPTGFSIAIPSGWSVSHQGHYVYLTAPSGGLFLLIDQSDQPKPNPLADWRQQEANRIGTYPGYHRIRLQAINYPQAEKAADWEFTYYHNGTLTHVLNRNVLANSRHAYALYWSTPESGWNQNFHIFEVFAQTFRPASG